MLFLSSSTNQRGFSLLEVLITAAIIGIVTAIAVVRYGSFNNVVLLKNQAYELALDLREAQIFSISVRGEGNEFREEYGIYLTTASPNQYILFQDTNGGHNPPAFTPGDIQIGEPQIIDSRFEIGEICVNGDTVCGITRLDISFQRPNFDAKIRAFGPTFPTGAANDARIVLRNLIETSATSSVIITGTGQITVE